MRDALEQGFYDDLLGIELADGQGVMPRELATLVHTGSTVIVDAVTERCLAAGENIVLEGTFSWPGLGRRLLTDLAEADYRKLTILDVEAPKEITKAPALSRWWRGRETALRTTVDDAQSADDESCTLPSLSEGVGRLDVARSEGTRGPRSDRYERTPLKASDLLRRVARARMLSFSMLWCSPRCWCWPW